MNNDDFVAELLQDWEWRSDELRILRNAAEAQEDTAIQETIRRSMILVLYAHFEGFCVFALSHYLTAINLQRLSCREASSAILAASWERVFQAMETGDEKCRIFQRPLPNDAKLHRHWRRRHFVEEIDRLLNTVAALPEDLVDAESNLKPWTLKRNLFLLGLDHDFVDAHSDTMNRLLTRRNGIAHGDERRGIKEDEFDKYEQMVLGIKEAIIDMLSTSHKNAMFSRRQDYAI